VAPEVREGGPRARAERAGAGAAATAAEALRSGAQLMLKEVAYGCCEPVRVVDAVVVRIYSCAEAGRVLVETGRRYPDGHSCATNCLPGTTKEPNETPEETVARIQKAILRAGECAMQFHFDRLDAFSEERCTEPSPGLRTLYRTRIVEGHVTSADARQRAGIGLQPAGPGGGAWSADAEGPDGSRCFSWLTEEEALERRVRLWGDGVGGLTIPLLVPAAGLSRGAPGTLSGGVADLAEKLNAIFQKDRRLPDLERGVAVLGAWLATEHTAASSMLSHKRAQQRFIVQHAGELRAFARALGDLERLRPCINPPGLRNLPAHLKRLLRLEARSAVAMGAGARLHERVAELASEYCQAVSSISAQLASWDGLLERGGL